MTMQIRTGKPLSKGERTKQQILTGALEVLATKGVSGTTHRAVAKAAGVSLSTTTYHFESLEDMLVRAFDLIATNWSDKLETALGTFIERVTTSGLNPDSPPEFRTALRDELANLAADYLHNPGHDRRVRLAAEMRFFYEAPHIAELQDRLDTYRAGLISQLQILPEKAGSETPELDASILFDAIQSMQFRALSRPAEASHPFLLARARRYLGWLLGC